MATEIKLRAERRFGEISSKLPTMPGKRTDLVNSIDQVDVKKRVLQSVGVSEQMAHRFEKLAEVKQNTIFN